MNIRAMGMDDERQAQDRAGHDTGFPVVALHDTDAHDGDHEKGADAGVTSIMVCLNLRPCSSSASAWLDWPDAIDGLKNNKIPERLNGRKAGLIWPCLFYSHPRRGTFLHMDNGEVQWIWFLKPGATILIIHSCRTPRRAGWGYRMQAAQKK